MSSVLIVIPYRDRKAHIDYYLQHTLPILRKYIPSFHVVIVEQADTKLFNRGKLINIGALEYKDIADYIITQDVDTNPLPHVVETYYTKELSPNIVQGIYTSAYDTMGGICKFHLNDFFRINGFPNDYSGWGCEDKALLNRAQYYGLTKKTFILNNDKHKDIHFKLFSDNHKRERDTGLFSKRTKIEYHTFRSWSSERKQQHILQSGIIDCKYNVVEQTVIQPNVTWIRVTFDD